MWGHTKLMTVLRYIWVRCRQHTHQHLFTEVFPQTFAGAVYNVCILGCKRYTWRLQTLSLADACICLVGRKYVQERLQVRGGAVASTCRNGCKYVRLNLDQIGSADALHCRTGCSALQDGLHCTAGRVAVHCVENHSFSPSLTDYVMSSEMRVSSRVHAYVYI